MDLHDDIRGRSPIQFLTPTDRTKPECRYQTDFREGYCEIRISSIPHVLFHYSVEILATVGRNFTIYLTNKIAKVH